MENCPVCCRPLVPFRAKLVCRTPGCGFMENCCDGGWMARPGGLEAAPASVLDVRADGSQPTRSLSATGPKD